MCKRKVSEVAPNTAPPNVCWLALVAEGRGALLCLRFAYGAVCSLAAVGGGAGSIALTGICLWRRLAMQR
jgi:hypothetical protein